MKYLMHKDIPVAKVYFVHDKVGNIEIINPAYMPIGAASDIVNLSKEYFSSWFQSRGIPSSRQNYNEIYTILGESPANKRNQTQAASLTDCYWLRDENSDTSWKNVNIHINGFSQNLCDVSMLKDLKAGNDFSGPDLTTDGDLIKGWIWKDNHPILIKGGKFGPNANGQHLLCANEVAASRIADLMKINHVVYYPYKAERTGELLCACECFIPDDTQEFVSANQLMRESKIRSGEALYHFFESIGLQKQVDQMIVFDYLIHNTDRHEKNFGIIQNPGDCSVIGFAPLFDNGSSFNWDYDSNTGYNYRSKPFANHRNDQIKIVTTKVDLPTQGEVLEILKKTYEEFQISEKNYQSANIDIRTIYRSFGQLLS